MRVFRPILATILSLYCISDVPIYYLTLIGYVHRVRINHMPKSVFG
jgi:hypothetical protein